MDGPPLGIDEELDITDDGITLPALSALPLSAIVGSVELFDCVDVDDVARRNSTTPVSPAARSAGCCAGPRPLAKPFPCKGGAPAAVEAAGEALTI